MRKALYIGLVVLILPLGARAATLSLFPAAISVPVNGTFSERIVVASKDVPINAASGELSFPSDILKMLSYSESGSIMSLWVQDPSFTNSAPLGTAEFAGIALNPGWSGSNGTVITATFKAERAGTAEISFDNAQVLANDGRGTGVLTATSPAKITVIPLNTSSTSPYQNGFSSIPGSSFESSTAMPPPPPDNISTLLEFIIVGILLTILVLMIVGLYLLQRHREAVSRYGSSAATKLLEDLKRLETDIREIESDLINLK